MAEITVIVPVYRAEAFLPACVESILDQTFSGFRLILVDDGSPDRCGRICEEYAEKDSRVTVLHQENQGQAAARNHALDLTDSTWVSFVDSDDLIHPRTLELLHRAAVESGAGIAMCRMLEAPDLPEDFFGPRTGSFQTLKLDDETMADLYDRGEYPAWVACGRLIRRELVEKHRFCPGRVFEDNEAVCRWMAGQTLARIPEDLYFYRTNPDSTTQSRFSPQKLDFLWALENIVRFYRGAGFEKTRRRFLDRYIRETADHCRMLRSAGGDPGAERRIRADFRRLMREERCTLSKEQFEYLLDAAHPRLIRLYWPAEGLVRTLRQEGLAGVFRKLGKHL